MKVIREKIGFVNGVKKFFKVKGCLEGGSWDLMVRLLMIRILRSMNVMIWMV